MKLSCEGSVALVADCYRLFQWKQDIKHCTIVMLRRCTDIPVMGKRYFSADREADAGAVENFFIMKALEDRKDFFGIFRAETDPVIFKPDLAILKLGIEFRY